MNTTKYRSIESMLADGGQENNEGGRQKSRRYPLTRMGHVVYAPRAKKEQYMRTAALAAGLVVVMIVSVDAFGQPCSGPYCPSNPYQPPPEFITNVCNAAVSQLNKTFTSAESASSYLAPVADCCGFVDPPSGWCTLNEWHDGSFSVALKSQSINERLRRDTYSYWFMFWFTLDAVVECFFDSAYQWRCGYQYSVFEFDKTYSVEAGRWAAMVLDRVDAIEKECHRLPYPASGDCVDAGWRRALGDLEVTFVPKVESELLPAVNQVANAMLH